MPEKTVEVLTNIGVCSGIAGLGGAMSYFLKVEEGKPFKWRELILHTAISAFCGFICYEVFSYEGFPLGLCGAFSGMAGWMGTRGARIVEVMLAKRAGVNEEKAK